MKKIVSISLSVLLFVSCSNSKPLATIGVATDMHYVSADDTLKLQEAIDSFKLRSTDFNVFLGDFVNADVKAAKKVSQVLGTSAAPVYCILGESDFATPYGTAAQDSLMKLLKVTQPYYSIDMAGCRFIFMDSNDNSTYSRPKVSVEWKKALEEINTLWGEGIPYGRPFNGSVGADQFEWLKEQLHDAQVREKEVIVFSHQPLSLTNVTHNALDGKMILTLFNKYPCVKACFSGHHHAGAMSTYGDFHNFVFKAMGESSNNRFAVIKVYKHKIEVEGFGDQPGAVLKLR